MELELGIKGREGELMQNASAVFLLLVSLFVCLLSHI